MNLSIFLSLSPEFTGKFPLFDSDGSQRLLEIIPLKSINPWGSTDNSVKLYLEIQAHWALKPCCIKGCSPAIPSCLQMDQGRPRAATVINLAPFTESKRNWPFSSSLEYFNALQIFNL